MELKYLYFLDKDRKYIDMTKTLTPFPELFNFFYSLEDETQNKIMDYLKSVKAELYSYEECLKNSCFVYKVESL